MTSKTLTNIADIAYETSIDEFRKVLSGFDSDFDRINSQTVGLGNFDIGKSISDSLSSSDAKVLNRLIGTISGGYFLRDMMAGKALETSAIKTAIVGKIEEVLNENNVENEPFYFYHHSGKGKSNKNIKHVVSSIGLPIANYDGYDIDKQDSDTNPSLGAVEFKRHTLSLGKRYGDALSLFFNCISNVDMSLCAPYLDVKILVPKNNTGKKSLGHEVQFRFIKEKSGKNFISKSIDKFNPFNKTQSEEDPYDTHGMEMFLSPQTLSNSNVRKQDKNILEPNNTLLTLKDCSINISGLGVGLFCSKTARISMTLHDRSRLRDIAPLITPKQFARSRVIIEYGWSHPQGGMTSSNTTGKFLNSLRDKGVFIVKGSSFSFTDGGHVDINIDLAMMGGTDSVVASVAAGDYVQANVFKSQIKDAIEVLKKENTEAVGVENIIPEKHLKISNAAGSKTLMKRSDYISIMEDIKKGDEASVTKALKKFIINLEEEQNTNVPKAINDKIRNLPYVDPTDTVNQDPFLLSSPLSSIEINEGTGVGDGGIPTFTSLGSVLMAFVAYPIQATHQFDEVQMFFYPMNQNSAGGYIHTTASFPICKEELINVFIGDDQDNLQTRNNMSVSRFMSRLEKKIIRNPVYKHYGLNSEYKLLHATKNLTNEMIKQYGTNSLDKDSKAIRAIDEFLRLNQGKGKQILQNVANRLTYVEDLKSKLAANEITKEEFTSKINQDKGLGFTTESIKQDLIKSINKNIKNRLSEIYSTYGNEIKSDDKASFSNEPKFCIPNLSYYFETINPHDNDVTSFKDIKDEFLRKNSKINEGKSILRIHVYDEEAIANKSQELLLSICNSRKVIDAVSESNLEIFESFKAQKDRNMAKHGYVNPNALTKKVGSTIVNNLDFNEVKDIIKHTMPSITIGSNFSNVKSFSANSTTSGEIANVLFITEQASQKKLSKEAGTLPALDSMDDLVVVPAVGSLNCPGMPLIQRGQQVFIDAGTGTSIDAIYTVQSVSHNISQGGFNTTANLMYSGQNRVESIREMVGKVVENTKGSKLTNKLVDAAIDRKFRE